jgi:ElaB/YqjD/DUF883 family membrane-anchored ribosome-binding protein
MEPICQKQELKNRIEAKQHELQARIAQLKADTRAEARNERARLEAKLKDLRDALSKGWDEVTERAAKALNALIE